MIKKLLIKIIDALFPSFLKRRHQKKVEKEFFQKHNKLTEKQKIIYALTPPPKLSNIGDHAQVVAIYEWFNDYFPGLPVIEVSKDECISMIKPLKRLVGAKDLIFLHSGGNLGDRGIWSETGRRNIIQNFPDNKIVSLPQTIFFSDTDKGRSEKEKTIGIYNTHKNLTVIGRDKESTRLASEMFPSSKTFSLPDFVLYLDPKDFIQEVIQKPEGALFCLRLDNESALSDAEKEALMKNLGMAYEVFDTTIKEPIEYKKRIEYLTQTLNYFNKFELVITDRYHGLIFASLLNKPTIVLPTVDHKLTSAIDWFKELAYIEFLQIKELNMLKKIKEKLLRKENNQNINWKEKYFEGLYGILKF